MHLLPCCFFPIVCDANLKTAEMNCCLCDRSIPNQTHLYYCFIIKAVFPSNVPNIYWFQCQYCEYLLPFFVVVLCDSTLNIFEILTVGRSKWTETNSLFSLALSHSPAKRSAEKNWPFLLSIANMIKDHPWEINTYVLCYKNVNYGLKKMHFGQISRTSFQINASMNLSVTLLCCLIAYLSSVSTLISHTYTHTHTHPDMFVYPLPAPALSGSGTDRSPGARSSHDCSLHC